MKKFIFLFIISIVPIYSQPKVPKLTLWATDLTNTLTQSELNDLNKRLKTYEDSTSNQVLSLMIKSLEGYPIEMLSYEIATENKIGTKKSDNGVLLLIAKDDRKLRIEVGYGLEGVLPDALTSSIIRNVIVPRLRAEQYYLAISDGIDAIISAIGGEYKSDKIQSENNEFPFILIVIIFIIFWMVIKKGGGPFIPGGIYRGSGSGWGSSGSGGSFGGGFSGGGGSFGGGGASGSW
ncbi:MAG TPA: TPM domain-containing protein [Ignavibacteriaceae bacterium]|nr:TPM domain-containing protein [Ignavibacteriaceae bacterium]